MPYMQLFLPKASPLDKFIQHPTAHFTAMAKRPKWSASTPQLTTTSWTIWEEYSYFQKLLLSSASENLYFSALEN